LPLIHRPALFGEGAIFVGVGAQGSNVTPDLTDCLFHRASLLVIPKEKPERKMASAAHYRDQAAMMRKFAESAPDDAMPQKFLELAADYDKLAKRADDRLQNRRPGSGSVKTLP